MFESLRRRFQPLVEVRVSPERIVFRRDAGEVSGFPALRVVSGKIAAFGDEARECDDGDLVEFFEKPHRRGRPWSTEAEFQLFCRYALMLLEERIVSLRPYVRVIGASSLDDILDGEQNDILTRALRSAGAAHVEIVGPSFAENGA